MARRAFVGDLLNQLCSPKRARCTLEMDGADVHDRGVRGEEERDLCLQQLKLARERALGLRRSHWWPWPVTVEAFSGADKQVRVRARAVVGVVAWDALVAEALRCLACSRPLTASRPLPGDHARSVPDSVLQGAQSLLRHEEAAVRWRVPVFAAVPLLAEFVGRCLEWLPPPGRSDLAALVLDELKKVGDEVMQKFQSWQEASGKVDGGDRRAQLQRCFGLGGLEGTARLDFAPRSLGSRADDNNDALLEQVWTQQCEPLLSAVLAEELPGALLVAADLRAPLMAEHRAVYSWLHRHDGAPALREEQPSACELLAALAVYHASRLQGYLCCFCGVGEVEQRREAEEERPPLCSRCSQQKLCGAVKANWTAKPDVAALLSATWRAGLGDPQGGPKTEDAALEALRAFKNAAASEGGVPAPFFFLPVLPCPGVTQQGGPCPRDSVSGHGLCAVCLAVQERLLGVFRRPGVLSPRDAFCSSGGEVVSLMHGDFVPFVAWSRRQDQAMRTRRALQALWKGERWRPMKPLVLPAVAADFGVSLVACPRCRHGVLAKGGKQYRSVDEETTQVLSCDVCGFLKRSH